MRGCFVFEFRVLAGATFEVTYANGARLDFLLMSARVEPVRVVMAVPTRTGTEQG